MSNLSHDAAMRVIARLEIIQPPRITVKDPDDSCALCGHAMAEHDVTGIQIAPNPRGFTLLCPIDETST